ncbi:MAG: glutathione S-transferase [Paracoccaceae bacterium]
MTYELLIGDRSYSSWSLRGWLLFAKFDLPVEVVETRLYEPGFAEALKAFAPARTVPVMRLPEGGVVMDTLAIAETLAERHSESGFWPKDANARGFARAITAEMHSGFQALRGDCPMNLRRSYAGFPARPEVRADLERIALLWAQAKSLSDGSGPWLFGAYSVADVFFAPVATRIATYQLPVDAAAQAYVATALRDPALLAWRDLGLKQAPQAAYDMPYETIGWTGLA